MRAGVCAILYTRYPVTRIVEVHALRTTGEKKNTKKERRETKEVEEEVLRVCPERKDPISVPG